MNESNIEHTSDGLIEKSSGRKIVSPLDYNFDPNKTSKELPEYTDEWIGAYLQFLDINIKFCERHIFHQGKNFSKEDEVLWASIINAYQRSRDRLTKADFI
jgi:hypothetical protein